jgi:hypothetical protein
MRRLPPFTPTRSWSAIRCSIHQAAGRDDGFKRMRASPGGVQLFRQ